MPLSRRCVASAFRESAAEMLRWISRPRRRVFFQSVPGGAMGRFVGEHAGVLAQFQLQHAS